MKPHSIKTIIFDLGGVLLNIDYSATIKAFTDIGLKDPEMAFSKQVQAEFFQRFEIGQVSPAEFLDYLIVETNNSSEMELEDAWCALLGNFPQARFKMLENLSERFELFILSNTNQIHQKRFEAHIDAVYGWICFESLFSKIYYSHEVGMRKPDRAIYEYVLKANGLKPSETLFLDDTPANLIEPKNLGINVLAVGGNEDVTNLLLPFYKLT